MSEWVKIAHSLPPVGQMVLLANANRWRGDDELGCAKDVGVLKRHHGLYWSTHWERRAMSSDAFTHWMAIDDPVRPPFEEPTSPIKDVAQGDSNG